MKIRSLTRDRLGGGRSDPNPLGFSWITSVALQASTQNFTYLFLHQFYVLTRNFGRFSRFVLFKLIQFTCNLAHGKKCRSMTRGSLFLRILCTTFYFTYSVRFILYHQMTGAAPTPVPSVASKPRRQILLPRVSLTELIPFLPSETNSSFMPEDNIYWSSYLTSKHNSDNWHHIRKDNRRFISRSQIKSPRRSQSYSIKSPITAGQPKPRQPWVASRSIRLYVKVGTVRAPSAETGSVWYFG